MRGKDGNLGNIGIRIIKNEIAYVVCGKAGIVCLGEAIVLDLDLIVVIESLNHLAALANVDDCSSPLAVFAIVEEVALDEHVACAAAFIPPEGVGFKLNSRAAAVEVVVSYDGLALRRKKHTPCAVIADDVILNERLGVVIKTFDDHTLNDIFANAVKSENSFIVIHHLDIRDRSLENGHLRILLEDLDAVTGGINIDTYRLPMLVSHEQLVARDLFDLRIDTVEIDGIVELIFKKIVLNQNLSAAVDKMACILSRRPTIFAVGSYLAAADGDVSALLCDKSHTPAGIHGDIFKNYVFTLCREERLTDTARDAEYDNISDNGRHGHVRNAESFALEFQIEGIEKGLAEVIVTESAADLFGCGIVFESSCKGHSFVLDVFKESSAVAIEFRVFLTEIYLDHFGARFNDLALEIADVDALYGKIFDSDILRTVDDCEVHTAVKDEGRAVAINGQTVEILDNESRALVAVVTVVRNAKNCVCAVFFINVIFAVRDVDIFVACLACGFERCSKRMSDRTERGVDEFHSCLRELKKICYIF